MKQLLKLSLFAAFCALTTVSFSQISFGAKAGLNLANVSFKGDGTESADPKIIPTFQVGGILEIGITEALAVQTGVSLQGKGFKLEDEILGVSFTATTSEMYIQVPAHILYRGSGFFVGVGPYVGYAVSGKTKVEAGGNSDSEKLSIGNTVDDDLAPIDFGVGIQAGVSFGSIRVGAGFDLGLSDITPKDSQVDGYSTKNTVINVFAAYMFGN